jgi:hypothetical protein
MHRKLGLTSLSLSCPFHFPFPLPSFSLPVLIFDASTPTIRVSSIDEERKSHATATTDTTDLEKHQAAPNAPLPLPSNLRRYSLLLLFSMVGLI